MAYEKNKTESYDLLGGINSKASPYINGVMEFRDLMNVNFFSPGALTKRPGSDLYSGATVIGTISGGVEFERLNGSSYIVVTANTNAYQATPSGYSAFKTGLANNAIFDFVTFVDRLFAANGTDFFKYDGTNTTLYSLPPGATGFGITAIAGGSLPAGNYVTGYGYFNDRGYFGPVSDGATITLDGMSFGSIGYYGLTTLLGYGITSLAFYRSETDSLDLAGTTFLPVGAGLTTGLAFVDTGFPLTTQLFNDNVWFTLAPRYMEIFNNQLFMAGFSSIPSTVYWSNIGEPEGIDPTFFAEFRTNDGDRVTGMKGYQGALVVTKERSFHVLGGDNPDNFFIKEVSDQYGCLSNRAMVVYENLLWFLDTKGIVEYTGANVHVISNQVEPIFQRMNIAAARDQAVGIHYRQYNEVWFSFPVDDSSVNNVVVVYDYLTKAWTRYDGVNPAVLFLAKGTLNNKTVFFGGYSGSLSYVSPSLMSDAGRAVTCLIDTRFAAPAGQTKELQWRRFYLDVDPILGITAPITIHFRTNYGVTIQLTRVMYQNPYQSRVDFGLPSRSIQAEIIQSSATLSFKVNGYTFESRFQRDT